MGYSRTVRISLGDVDSAQVIYFPTVYRWHEYNFSEWLAANFLPLREILASNFGLPVVHSSAEYLSPLHQDDSVTLESRVADIGRTSLTFRTDVLEGAQVAVIVETKHVWVTCSPAGEFKAAAFPAELAAALATDVSPG